jgi:hypothetical protein
MELEVLPGSYAICRLEADAIQPIWARSAAGADLLSVTWSDTEMSVVCPEQRLPAGMAADRGLVALRVRATFESALNGGLAALTAPLYVAGLAVLTVSTQGTDHLLVSAVDLDRARLALEAAGHYLVVPGDTIALAGRGLAVPGEVPSVTSEAPPAPGEVPSVRGETPAAVASSQSTSVPSEGSPAPADTPESAELVGRATQRKLGDAPAAGRPRGGRPASTAYRSARS